MVSKHPTNSSLSRLSSLQALLSRRSPLRRPWRWLLMTCLILASMWFIPPVWKLLLGPIKVTRWTKKDGQITAIVGPGEKGWVQLNKISKHAIYAVIAAEDGKFYSHSGFDFDSIKKAYETNKKRGKYVRGGSTISQQTIKMAFLGREKTLIRKAREAVGTALIELMLSKNDIMEWYLNLAEFGDGVYGIHNGAQYYFRTRPELLTIAQAIQLAMVLPSPNTWSRGLRNHRLSDFGQRRFAAIANNMRTSGHISATQWDSTMRSGDFGRPIASYQALLAAQSRGEMLCPGDPNCPSDSTNDETTLDEDIDQLGGFDGGSGEENARAQPTNAPNTSSQVADPQAQQATTVDTTDAPDSSVDKPAQAETSATIDLDPATAGAGKASDASLFDTPQAPDTHQHQPEKEAPADF